MYQESIVKLITLPLRQLILPALVLAVALLGIAQPSHAANTNNIATACVEFGTTGSAARTLAPFVQGVRNTSAEIPIEVSCPIVRESLSPGVTSFSMFIDGDLESGGTLSCTVRSYDSFGVLKAQKPFTATALHFESQVFFTIQEASDLNYLGLRCTLPPRGVIRGISVNH
jgi:hypothetical protein